ncbi:MAG: nucleoside hydrolase [Lactovum sp.]
MKRSEKLKKLDYKVPGAKKKRVIIHADIACEVDDQFALVHHLLTPCEEVLGIIASHFEWKFRNIEGLKSRRFTSMEKSYAEGKKLLELMEIDDVPLLKGAKDAILDKGNLPESPGADFIIQESLKKIEEPLYVVLQGALTDLAIAYLKEPRIIYNVIAIWIGGAAYPEGGQESNLQEDVYAAQVLFSSEISIWQIPINCYAKSYISFSELVRKVKICGKIGTYLFEKMFALNDWYGKVAPQSDFPHGEVWLLGDQSTVSALLESSTGKDISIRKAPKINDDMTYGEEVDTKKIIIFNSVDRRMLFDDFFAKIWLCYKN